MLTLPVEDCGQTLLFEVTCLNLGCAVLIPAEAAQMLTSAAAAESDPRVEQPPGCRR